MLKSLHKQKHKVVHAIEVSASQAIDMYMCLYSIYVSCSKLEICANVSMHIVFFRYCKLPFYAILVTSNSKGKDSKYKYEKSKVYNSKFKTRPGLHLLRVYSALGVVLCCGTPQSWGLSSDRIPLLCSILILSTLSLVYIYIISLWSNH